MNEPFKPEDNIIHQTVDFSTLYDMHADYIARRKPGSFEQAQIEIEVRLFKIPNLLNILPENSCFDRILEIGCATGELIAKFPVNPEGMKVGVDISEANILAAKEHFPEVKFYSGDFREISVGMFDIVILSDILEHVPDDIAFLHDAAAHGETIVVNLPLEDNWLNITRHYGPKDTSGHLRKYSLNQGLTLIRDAGLEILDYRQVWAHETPTTAAKQELRQQYMGSAFAGPLLVRCIKLTIFRLAVLLPFFGRRLFASNLFIAARRSCKVSL